MRDFLKSTRWASKKIRFPDTSSASASSRCRARAPNGWYARPPSSTPIDNDNAPRVTLVHKGNIMKFTEGAFRDWGYEPGGKREFGGVEIDGGPWLKVRNPCTGRDIVDQGRRSPTPFCNRSSCAPRSTSVIATLNLNGDYISDALAAQVGGIGIAPGANLSDTIAMFEATHGTAPKYAGKDYVNPGSEILSAEMMLRHMGWTEAADLVIHAMEKAILSKRVTYDFARLMEGATQVSCSGFGQVLIDQM